MPHRAVLGPTWVAPREKSPHQPFPDFSLLCPRARKRIRRKLAACIILSYKQLGRALGRQTLLCFFALLATMPSRVLGADNDCLPQKWNNMLLFHRIRRNCPFLWCPRKLQPPGLFIAHGRHSCVSLDTSGLKFLNRVWQSLCQHLLGIQGFLNLLLFFGGQGITSWLGVRDETARTLQDVYTTSQGIIYSCGMMPWRSQDSLSPKRRSCQGSGTLLLLGGWTRRACHLLESNQHWQATVWQELLGVGRNRRKACVSSPWRAGWHLGLQREQEEHPLRERSTNLEQMRYDKIHCRVLMCYHFPWALPGDAHPHRRGSRRE